MKAETSVSLAAPKSVSTVDVWLQTDASARAAGEETTVPAPVMTNTGAWAAVNSVNVKTEPCATP